MSLLAVGKNVLSSCSKHKCSVLFRTFGNSHQNSFSTVIRSNITPAYLQKKYLTTSSNELIGLKTKEHVHKNIYKDIGYKAPFGPEESVLILQKLNSMSEDELAKVSSKPNAAIIIKHREQYGEFGVVEEVLAAKNIDEKILERMGKKVIKYHWQQDAEETVSNIESANKKKRMAEMGSLLKGVKPKLPTDEYESDSVNAILGIKLSLQSLSYAYMDTKSKKILSWESIPVFDHFSKSHFEHPNLYSMALDIVNQLPTDADIFVFEEQLL